MITTVPGFSSRSTTTHLTQFPQRDGEVMEEPKPGWSNGPHVEDEKDALAAHEAQTNRTSEQIEAGFSNSAPDSPAAMGAGTSVTAQADLEPEAEADPEPEPPAKKTAAKKTTAKKG